MAEECREVNNTELTSALFISVYKLFFKRAPETKALLQRLFTEVVSTGNDAHLKQRAIFLYRLMRTDLAKAQEFANQSKGQF